MTTSQDDCIDALRDAADRVGEPPTKAQYEELGMTPAASTILRVVGGWNEAKERAGLTTNPSTGSRVESKPDDVSIPDGEKWTELSQDQRWHYRNVQWNTERTLRRRARLRQWANDRKADSGCSDCGETDPACLDFHHRSGDAKAMAVTDLITYGHGTAALREEIERCEVLCANCHRKRHGRTPAIADSGRSPETKRERLQQWTFEHRRKQGCNRCDERSPVCLQFHHTDPDEKEASVSTMIADSADEAAVRAEVDRCLVLCANCHRRVHFEPPVDGHERRTESETR